MISSEAHEQIKQLYEELGNLISEVQKSDDKNFFITAIQQNAISIYNKASGLNKKQEISQTVQEPITEDKKVLESYTEPVVVNPPEIKKEIVVPPPIRSIQDSNANTIPAEEKKIAPSVKAIVTDPPSEEEEISINERFSKGKVPVLNYAEKSKETPIKDLSKAISIGKKFEFINLLFGGNSDAYKNCINNIQNSDSYETAVAYLEAEISNTPDWEENEKLGSEFFALVRRRFMK